MKFIKTTDLVCNREISLNIQGVDITYLEKIGPRITLVHFANGGTVKVPLSKDWLEAQMIEANDPGPSMLMVPESVTRGIDLGSMNSATIIGDQGLERRKGTSDRRSTSALEQPPKKHGDKSKHEDDK